MLLFKIILSILVFKMMSSKLMSKIMSENSDFGSKSNYFNSSESTDDLENDIPNIKVQDNNVFFFCIVPKFFFFIPDLFHQTEKLILLTHL